MGLIGRVVCFNKI